METATGPGVECAHVTVFWPMKSCRQMSPGDRSENNKKKLFSLYSDNNHYLEINVNNNIWSEHFLKKTSRQKRVHSNCVYNSTFRIPVFC